MNSYNDIKLDIIKELNSRVLNNSFTKLAENDVTIVPENNYIPKIWECKWFNDKSKSGYSKGECVWVNAITSENDFLNSYGNKVYEYAKNNNDLQYILSLDWTNTCKLEDSDFKNDQIFQYKNILSGYSKNIGTNKNPDYKQIYNKLFDYKNNNTEKLVIYISYVDNNKEYLSNSNSWKNIVLSSEDEYKNFISTEIQILFSTHIKDYHLGGLKTIEEYDSALMAKNLSNFNQNNLYSKIQLKNHNSYTNQQGIDFVKQFVKLSSSSSIDKNFILYKWFRLWNSGYLEHGGIIECPPNNIAQSNYISDYYIEVNLNWKYKITKDKDFQYAKTYDYDLLSTNFYEKEYSYLYLSPTHDFKNSISGNINRYNRYNIQITPIEFSLSSDLSNNHFVDFDALKSINYPSCNITHKNKVYAINEIFDITNSSFKITKNNVNNLSDNTYYQYYQYYTTGYCILN